VKLIRERMEDFEYLKLAEAKDPAAVKALVDALFPTGYDTARTPAELETARAQLFAPLDVPPPPDAGVPQDLTVGGAPDGGADEMPSLPSGGCSCRVGARR
jgi:hypothetical protein